jgi:hypothetical protein
VVRFVKIKRYGEGFFSVTVASLGNGGGEGFDSPQVNTSRTCLLNLANLRRLIDGGQFHVSKITGNNIETIIASPSVNLRRFLNIEGG